VVVECEISREKVPLLNAYKHIGQRASVRLASGAAMEVAVAGPPFPQGLNRAALLRVRGDIRAEETKVGGSGGCGTWLCEGFVLRSIRYSACCSLFVRLLCHKSLAPPAANKTHRPRAALKALATFAQRCLNRSPHPLPAYFWLPACLPAGLPACRL
jgi:hypothetical protein